jgi:hypothetical protein
MAQWGGKYPSIETEDKKQYALQNIYGVQLIKSAGFFTKKLKLL